MYGSFKNALRAVTSLAAFSAIYLPLQATPAAAGPEAYADPTNGDVPVARETRADTDRVRKLAFPTAEGYGRFADAGIGPGEIFQVIKVTNLNDSGTGSFRSCYLAVGPRVCVFTVSGTISVDTDMLAKSSNSRLYVAGQTSPGGIQLKSGPGNSGGPLRTANMSDVIIRYVASRVGTGHKVSTNGQGPGAGGDYRTWNAKNIMFDHISEQWHTDDGMNIAGADNATIQWSIQSEPLACPTCRSDLHNNHDYGAFLTNNNRLSVHHNLFMGGRMRNPNINANVFDLANNVIYNYSNYATQIYVGFKTSAVGNIIANWYSIGPRLGNMQESGQRPHCVFAAFEGQPTAGKGFGLYLDGNICRHDLTGKSNMVKDGNGVLTSPVLYQKGTLLKPDGTPGVLYSSPVNGGVSVNTTDANTAFQMVTAYAGSLRDMHKTPRRDDVDARAVSQVRTCTGASDKLTAVPAPGYPDLAAGSTWSWDNDDTDNDGMLDSWELSFPGVTSLAMLKPNGDFDGDGWSDMEEFLNYLAGDHLVKKASGPVPPPYCGQPA